MSNCKKGTLLVAAAGSGKTTEIIRRVRERVNGLSPYKILAVITYTNAATNEIKDRLELHMDIPSNVFIGTIHSFLMKYLVQPYATATEEIESEAIISNYEIQNLPKNGIAKMKREKQVRYALSQKGILDYDYIITLSNKLLKNKKVKERFSQRLEYVFVDEFQDAVKTQFDILETLRKSGRTNVVLVGDPEQSIMGFTTKKKNKNGISKVPIVTIQEKTTYSTEKLEMNYRSTQKIVDFINNFHSFIQQEKANDEITADNEVLFISESKKNQLISKFNELCIDPKYCTKKPRSKMFVAHENKMYQDYTSSSQGKLGKNSTAIEFVLDMLSQILSKHKYELAESLDLENIDLRSKCLTLFKDLKAKPLSNVNDLKTKLELDFDLTLDSFEIDNDAKPRYVKILENFCKDIHVFSGYHTTANRNNLGCCNDIYLTIHKAKGLQADAVLAIAKNEKELLKWLETDKEKRICAEDDCRLGYVAFSRAKYFLCIGCIGKISDSTKSKLAELGVVMV